MSRWDHEGHCTRNVLHIDRLYSFRSSRNEFLSDPVDLTLDYWIAASATDAGGGANMGSSFDRPDRSAAQASFPGSSSETKKSSSTDVSKNVKTSIRYVDSDAHC